MASRRNRPKHVTNVEQFTADVMAMHQVIIRYNMALHTGHDHYRAMRDLHLALTEAAETVLGKVPWLDIVRTSPGE